MCIGLPVEVRDKALNLGSDVPQDNVNRAYVAQNAERKASIHYIILISTHTILNRLKKMNKKVYLIMVMLIQLGVNY
jgi:hypothetical protein